MKLTCWHGTQYFILVQKRNCFFAISLSFPFFVLFPLYHRFHLFFSLSLSFFFMSQKATVGTVCPLMYPRPQFLSFHIKDVYNNVRPSFASGVQSRLKRYMRFTKAVVICSLWLISLSRQFYLQNANC